MKQTKPQKRKQKHTASSLPAGGTGRFQRFWHTLYVHRASYLFLLPFSIVFFTFTVLPVLTAIGYSFTSFNIFEAPVFTGLENYTRLFLHDADFKIALKNTLVIGLVLGAVGYFLSLAFAWLINEMNPKVRAVLTLLFYAPSMANVYVVWKTIFSSDAYGVANAYLMQLGVISGPVWWLQDEQYMFPVVLIILIWASLGTSFLSFIAGFQTIDPTLYEAAAMDGVKNRFQELWYITLPSMKPQLAFGAITSITAAFGVGDAITALVGFPSPNHAVHTVVTHLTDYGFTRFEMGYACAIATVLFFIMMLANQLVQKMIRKVGQ